MAFLLGNISFNSAISAQFAHQIVKIADALTYRQLCILKLAATTNNYSLRTSDYRSQNSFEKAQYQLLYECLDLYSRALIKFGSGVVFGLTDIKPGALSLEGIGVDMFNEMGLVTIPKADLDPVAEQLSN